MKTKEAIQIEDQRLEMGRLRNIMDSPETETIKKREAQEKYMQLNADILNNAKNFPNLSVKIDEEKFKVTDVQVDILRDFVKQKEF
jgi:uncharacterized Zn finger protein